MSTTGPSISVGRRGAPGGIREGPPLTARQREVLDVIRRANARDGWPVGPAWLGKELSIGRGRAKVLLARLYTAGYLEHRPFDAGPGMYRPRPGMIVPAEGRPARGRCRSPAVVAAIREAADRLVYRRRWPAVRLIAAKVGCDKATATRVRARLIAAGKWPDTEGLRRGSGSDRVPAPADTPAVVVPDAGLIERLRAAKRARGEPPTGTRTVRVPRVHRCHASEDRP
jgi:hypothetical protein